jgi:hypothetical protein
MPPAPLPRATKTQTQAAQEGLEKHSSSSMNRIQRLTQMCVNSTGPYGALRVDYRPREIEVRRRRVEEDLGGVWPFMDMDLGLEENREREGCLKKRPLHLPT